MGSGKIVVVTGATGFIGGRLCADLVLHGCDVRPIGRHDDDIALRSALAGADAVAHCAGVTRPRQPREFDEGNAALTQRLANAIRDAGVRPLVLFTSSVRAAEDTHYGRTKRAAEDELLALADDQGCTVAIFRLPQVFGRGARAHYNSIVATVLADAVAGRTTPIERSAALLDLVDIADVVTALTATILQPPGTTGLIEVSPCYASTVGAIAAMAARFSAEPAREPETGLEAALWDAYHGYAEDAASNAAI